MKSPLGLARSCKLRKRCELRVIFFRSIVRSEIAAVGRADPRHVVIVLAPCIIAAAASDVSCLPSLLLLSFSFGAAAKHRRRYARHATRSLP
jgi:hypothetical protein